MRSRPATDVPPNFMTRRGIIYRTWTFPETAKGGYTYRRGGLAAMQLIACKGADRNDKVRMVNTKTRASSIDQAEVERFSRHAADWWDARGPMAALHKFNPVRLAYIRDQAAKRFARAPKKLDCLKGLRMLDIGCGGGILSEPLARLGADVVGADPSEENIAAASTHAQENDVVVDDQATTAEDLAEKGERFDIVLAMEVVEHVNDMGAFVATCASMVKPGGLMIAATLNRTLKSFALAIVGAEYVLRWLPRGTHQWDKFVTPNELEIALERSGLQVIGERGVIYNPFADRWQLSSDTDVNYMLVAERPAGKEK
ncbi:MAG: bifunctional 2-polyprenyl-6-hydroxyphenol methylase/3-demethylubiquinol 3-O-methyltransferase UbiG [Pseudolabrys sp.]